MVARFKFRFYFKRLLFGGVTLGKNVSLDKYIYTINVNTFRVDTSSSVHIDNKKKDVLILSKGPIKVLDNYYVNRRSSIFN